MSKSHFIIEEILYEVPTLCVWSLLLYDGYVIDLHITRRPRRPLSQPGTRCTGDADQQEKQNAEVLGSVVG